MGAGWAQASLRILATIVLATACQSAWSACFTLTDTEGNVYTASDIWQVKNRLDSRSTLMGSVAGKEKIVPVADVRTITFNEQSDGWLSRLGGDQREALLTLRSGETTSFRSSLVLSYKMGDKTRQIALGNLASVVRCTPQRSGSAAVTSDTYGVIDTVITPSATVSSSARVYLFNGDILDGKLLTPELILKTDYALLSVTIDRIKTVRHPENATGRIVVEFDRNNRATGDWIDSSVELQISDDQVITLDSELIRAIEFSHRLPVEGLKLQ